MNKGVDACTTPQTNDFEPSGLNNSSRIMGVNEHSTMENVMASSDQQPLKPVSKKGPIRYLLLSTTPIRGATAGEGGFTDSQNN